MINLAIVHEYINPCQPSPCGPNSQCREQNSQAICSCLPEFSGQPPNCRPECITSLECPLDKACMQRKCVDPCPGVCGQNAYCLVRNHAPLCSCEAGLTGNPFVRCLPLPKSKLSLNYINKSQKYTNKFPIVIQQDVQVYRDPCQPSPCGLFATCRVVNGNPSCACLANYEGQPPNCHPECNVNAECLNSQACVNQKCIDPCPGACGLNAVCNVINHIPSCTCVLGYVGDASIACQLPVLPSKLNYNYFNLRTRCKLIMLSTLAIQHTTIEDPCNPSPCGQNALCSDNGICKCVGDYRGDPYVACKPECMVNSECSHDKACINQKCQNPCPGACAPNAICQVVNHVPMCHCPEHMTGNAFSLCSPIQSRFSFLY